VCSFITGIKYKLYTVTRNFLLTNSVNSFYVIDAVMITSEICID